jgi:site-specific recombinase XerD
MDGIVLEPTPCIRLIGKGRKERALPLGPETAHALRDWLKTRGDSSQPHCFLNRHGLPLTRWGLTHVLRRYRADLVKACNSAQAKRLSPHVLRHTCAMNVLAATKDLRKVALWLGHESITTTEIYTRASPEEKFEVLKELVPFPLRRGHFRPPDAVLALLQSVSSPGQDNVASLTG